MRSFCFDLKFLGSVRGLKLQIHEQNNNILSNLSSSANKLCNNLTVIHKLHHFFKKVISFYVYSKDIEISLPKSSLKSVQILITPVTCFSCYSSTQTFYSLWVFPAIKYLEWLSRQRDEFRPVSVWYKTSAVILFLAKVNYLLLKPRCVVFPGQCKTYGFHS